MNGSDIAAACFIFGALMIACVVGYFLDRDSW